MVRQPLARLGDSQGWRLGKGPRPQSTIGFEHQVPVRVVVAADSARRMLEDDEARHVNDPYGAKIFTGSSSRAGWTSPWLSTFTRNPASPDCSARAPTLMVMESFGFNSATAGNRYADAPISEN
jgi:hypothetical protein